MRKKMMGPMGPQMSPPHVRQPRRKGVPPGYGSPGGNPVPGGAPQGPPMQMPPMKEGGQYGTGGMKNPNKPAQVSPTK